MRGAIVLACALVAAPARADTIGVVVTGDPALQTAVQDATATWLRGHGHAVNTDALPADAINTMVDCYVIDNAACAQAVVDKRAAQPIVFVAVDKSSADVKLAIRWLAKGRPAREQRAACSHCDGALVTQVDAALTTLVGASATAAPAAATTRTSAPAPAASESHGLAIGAELGEPTAATVGWFAGKVGVSAALGSGTFAGPGLAAHASVHVAVADLRPHTPLSIGLGGRLYHHGYDAMSADEVPDTHYGVYASVAIALDRGAMQLYAELAPGLDVARTRSCTLADGPRTICPHAQEAPVFIDFAIGARWFLSR